MNSTNKINISVVIPMYNSGKVIGRTLTSILDASKQLNIQIIVVDDGSIDHSLEEVMKFQNIYKNIKLLTQEHLGVSFARNKGIKEATGDYIMFVDSDDRISKNSLDILYENAIKNTADISIGLIKVLKNNEIIRRIDENNKIEILSQKQILKTFLIGKANFDTHSACAKIYSKNIYSKITFEEGKSSNEDRYFFFQAIELSKLNVIQNTIVYIYEKRNNSLSTAMADNRLFDSIYFARKIKEYIEKNEEWAIELANYNLLITEMLVYRSFYRNASNAKMYKKKLRVIKKQILLLSKEVKISKFKKVEIFIIKYVNFLYPLIIKITDKLRKIKKGK